MVKKIGIIVGSMSDIEIVKEAYNLLEEFGVEYEIVVSSAHRTPQKTAQWSTGAEERGIAVIIAFAGAAAHLAGVVASYTNLPVIAVPVPTPPLSGVDSLLAAVQMPGGVPVAVMAIGKAGAKNAALFACQILALNDLIVKEKLEKYRLSLQEKIEKDNEELKKCYNNQIHL
jgi:5-(carboxyamino)imidazole ribonucleotide mutase